MKVANLQKETKHYEKMIANYDPEFIDLSKCVWVGSAKQLKLIKQKSDKNLKIIAPPISMTKLIELLDKDEYHYSCVDAISESCFVKFECKNKQAKAFFEKIQLPKNEDLTSILSDFVFYYIACGNGFLNKMRSLTGEWVGLNRLIPSEVQIVEKYDNYGFLDPDYLQVKAGKKTFFEGKDIIHLLQTNSLSNAWGVACKQIILNIETLSEIKQFDFNRFKNGLLLDYIIIIEGGSLGEKETIRDEQTGETREIDPFEELTKILEKAKGNKNSHGLVLIESGDQGVKIRLEPMRQNETSFQELKKDLRDSIIVYHRVPHRLVSQETPGKLGGDNNSDLQVFYNMVIKPLQGRVADILSRELNREFGWNVKKEDFDFGNISVELESFDTKLFREE